MAGISTKLLLCLAKKGKHVEFDQIKEIIKKIKIKNYDQRITQLGLRPDRADVIDYASKIYLRSM